MNESICGDSCHFVKLKALIKPPTHTPTPFIKKSNWKYLWHINMFGLQLWALHISCSVGKFHTASNTQVNLHHFNELTDYSSSIGTYLISHQRPSQRAAVSGFWWHLDTSWYELLHLIVKSISFHPSYVCKYHRQASRCHEYRVPLPRENVGVWGNICRIETRVMPVRTAFYFYSQAKACLSAQEPTLAHVKRLHSEREFSLQRI